MPENIIEVKNITYQYADGVVALNQVSMNIEKGKKVAVIGSNGAGKSTLFLHMNGINKPKAGEICFKGKKIEYTNTELIKLRKEVGVVFQEPDNQLFSANVFQEISFGPMNLKLSKETVINRVQKAMELTNITDLKDKPVHFLSFGQKKRVTIASVLSMEPSVLIMDEPTSGLDPENVKAVGEILDDLNKAGTTIVISTHDIDFAYAWADYIYIMSKGRILGQGLPEEVFKEKELISAAGIKQPWLVELYMELFGCSSEKPLPRKKEELLDLIRENKGSCGL